MEMSNLTAKLKSLELELGKDLIVHLVLISLPTHFGQFKVSYNIRTNGPSMNLYLTMCKRKRDCRKIRLKGLLNERNQYIQIFVLDIKIECVKRVNDVLELIHIDICGPFPTTS
ncbi:hypothetical protein CR513_13793, partial [Mucuna pruriens]